MRTPRTLAICESAPSFSRALRSVDPSMPVTLRAEAAGGGADVPAAAAAGGDDDITGGAMRGGVLVWGRIGLRSANPGGGPNAGAARTAGVPPGGVGASSGGIFAYSPDGGGGGAA